MTVAGGSRAIPGPLTQAIAAILRAQVELLGMTQIDLATQVDVSQTQIGRYLRAERVPNIEELLLICEVLDLDLFEDVLRPASR